MTMSFSVPIARTVSVAGQPRGGRLHRMIVETSFKWSQMREEILMMVRVAIVETLRHARGANCAQKWTTSSLPMNQTKKSQPRRNERSRLLNPPASHQTNPPPPLPLQQPTKTLMSISQRARLALH